MIYVDIPFIVVDTLSSWKWNFLYAVIARGTMQGRKRSLVFASRTPSTTIKTTHSYCLALSSTNPLSSKRFSSKAAKIVKGDNNGYCKEAVR